MSYSSASNIFSQALLADYIDAESRARVDIINSPYVSNLANTLVSKPGASATSIDVPYFQDKSGNVGAQTWTGSDFSEDGRSVAQLNIPLIDSAVNYVDDLPALRNLANYADAEQQIAKRVVNDAMAEVVKAIYSKINAVTANQIDITADTTTINLKALSRAKYSVFGDKAAQQRPLVIMHSLCMNDFQNDPDVKNALQYSARPDEAGWMESPGFVYYTSDLVTRTTSATPDEFNTYLLLPGAVLVYLEFMLDGMGDTVRKPNTLKYNTVYPFRYGVAVSPDANSGVASIVSNSSLVTA